LLYVTEKFAGGPADSSSQTTVIPDQLYIVGRFMGRGQKRKFYNRARGRQKEAPTVRPGRNCSEGMRKKVSTLL
jgi:hypothetical protein